MASPMPESLACNTGDADFQGIEVSEIDGAMLMSFLEESQGEERNEDGLNSIIRSLEAEINSDTMEGRDLTLDPEFIGDVEDGRLRRHMDGHDCAVPHDQLGFGWVDMEPQPVPWYMEPCEIEMDGVIEFGGLSDYSHMNYGIALDQEQGYRSLWQETYDTIMYDQPILGPVHFDSKAVEGTFFYYNFFFSTYCKLAIGNESFHASFSLLFSFLMLITSVLQKQRDQVNYLSATECPGYLDIF